MRDVRDITIDSIVFGKRLVGSATQPARKVTVESSRTLATMLSGIVKQADKHCSQSKQRSFGAQIAPTCEGHVRTPIDSYDLAIAINDSMSTRRAAVRSDGSAAR
jgi:hypothetical protein